MSVHYHLKRWRLDNPEVVDTGESFVVQAEALFRQRQLQAMSTRNHFFVEPCEVETCRPRGQHEARQNGTHPVRVHTDT